MLDHSSKDAPLDLSDPLTEMLRGLRLDGVEYGRCRLPEPWATSFPAQEAARFHFISSGSAWLQTPSGEWLELRAGDAALLPRGDAHVLASIPGLTPLPFDRFGRKEVCQGVFDVQCADACGGTVALTASMRFNIDKLHPLLQLMPEAMLTSDLARNEPSIPHLLDAMAREVDMDRVGAGGILARLADVLTATLIRTWVEHGCGDTTGWIAAVRNPEVGRVLAAIHLQPDRDWNIASLARLMGASRSGFAERFLRVVGETPARYVARVRMHQARQWLRDGERVATVAERLGYDAEASFSRAFKRIIGTPPSHFRNKGEGEAIRDFG
ncbi:AraC family transcriptional regulator [Neorhizobium galegae]|uniref:AraC family transcriptional regulator n=1 Tax=Neorhizobium galegae TaxID=399 RepID=UPI000620EB12|nr:AraC family transcriptional regulator [Neorhizobium galegae]CDZ55332.1 Transcriptional regulator, AraC family [Neorhizobium galegae bv. orientalis]KAB1125801.1 AraC family transcriptional regulator [Neorhizobium galegae]MCQ1806075.1 AraC family transcriptional regulator [Neorhizobium galegae]MCQ1836934.1 AraC family transcriptional regulator [Neorhizobium galegae]UIY30878.1 AraC family transcriptional regulator [Neorhizobium galegae]